MAVSDIPVDPLNVPAPVTESAKGAVTDRVPDWAPIVPELDTVGALTLNAPDWSVSVPEFVMLETLVVNVPD